MARHWTCQKCGTTWARTKQKCTCGRSRPKPRKPEHQLVLEHPYEWWLERFGDRCNICGQPQVGRRLNRDHDHVTGVARGLLCANCNRKLGTLTGDWLELALAYVSRRRDPEVRLSA